MQISNSNPLTPNLEIIANQIKAEAERSRGNPVELLSLLRVLEDLHKDIRENFFLSALPANRQALYALLRDIEQNGGWPYIPRFKIREFLQQAEENEDTSLP